MQHILNSRIDLSEWLIHFIREPNEDDIPERYKNDAGRIPLWFDEGGQKKFSDYSFLEQEYEDEHPLSNSLDVLNKILFDGFIKANWSFRKSRPTIYGPRAAVCFTEMPLYALVNYAKMRNNRQAVNTYGIAVPRRDLFKYGGRQVIYGLSTEFAEASAEDKFFGQGFRTLAARCGIALREQYRYVSTNLEGSSPIDWTHEREWRWPYQHRLHFYHSGLPIWLEDDICDFHQVIIIVTKSHEANATLKKLKEMYDSGSNNYSREYSLQTVLDTKVLALEELVGIDSSKFNLRIDDLPLHSLPQIKLVEPSKEVLIKVKAALHIAKREAIQAVEARASVMRDENGLIKDIFGFANVVTYESDSEVTAALLKMNYAVAMFDRGYYVHEATSNSATGGLLSLEEAGAQAAAAALTRELRQDFHVSSRWD